MSYQRASLPFRNRDSAACSRLSSQIKPKEDRECRVTPRTDFSPGPALFYASTSAMIILRRARIIFRKLLLQRARGIFGALLKPVVLRTRWHANHLCGNAIPKPKDTGTSGGGISSRKFRPRRISRSIFFPFFSSSSFRFVRKVFTEFTAIYNRLSELLGKLYSAIIFKHIHEHFRVYLHFFLQEGIKTVVKQSSNFLLLFNQIFLRIE